MDTPIESFWKKCSTCKKPIALGAKYFVCSVSTCSGQRTGYVFCSHLCFESHLPGARHRDAGAIEKLAPINHEPVASEAERGPARIIIKDRPQGASVSMSGATTAPQEILIVASRLKDYISARSQMNTSAAVMDVLSDHVRSVCERAIENARSEGRVTVLDRDFTFLKNLK